ncbi:MAG: peptidoglycan bridge formation glycyltransferase FemA/FemB family protein [Ruminococcus sp.]|nr:peptidoglycan bridge formation glycyltransferase FemA/FemB family protein [Ruminococcus sp.]
MKVIIDFNNDIEREEYEKFVSGHENGSFTQSLKWADVKEGWGHEAVAVKDGNGNIKGTALILLKKLPFIGRTFFYCPRGPVYTFGDTETLKELLDAIRDLAAEYRACQFKCDPFISENDEASIAEMKAAGFAYKNISEDRLIQSKYNYKLNFNGRTKDEVFAGFHKKWRYNIRVAERHGVKCRVYGREALDDFCELVRETGERDGFCVRDKSYFEAFLDNLGDNAKLYMTYCDGTPLSGAVYVKYGKVASYVYGASTVHMRKVMPNYLMQWTMISDSIDAGCDVYDFQGIPHYYDENHSNYGVYRFKSGFGGEVAGYAGEFKMIYDRKASHLVETAICLRKLFLKAAALFSLDSRKEINEKPLTFPQKLV